MLTCQKALFDLPDDVHFLNCSTISANLKSSVEAGYAGIQRKSRPHEITPEDFFTDATETRALFARLVNCTDSHRIALIPSVSYGTATVAKNLPRKPGLRAGQEILVVFEEFPSDVYAWEEVCQTHGLTVRTIHPPATATGRGDGWNVRLLEAITEKTCLVMVPNVHWADGTRFDLPALRRRTREVGAWLVVDGSQSLGVLPFDVQALQPDALITVGYKYLLGPYGMGLSYWSETFDDGTPLERNWINRVGSENFGGLVNYQSDYRPAASRYNMGEQSNFILLPMLNAALRQLLAWDVAAIQDYCGRITAHALPALRELGFWVEEPAWRANHLTGLRLPAGLSLDAVRQSLARHRVNVSIRSDSIRVSTHVWNTPDDLTALVDALRLV
jgi:selenocysteine lyase/cysteine desulfurase